MYTMYAMWSMTVVVSCCCSGFRPMPLAQRTVGNTVSPREYSTRLSSSKYSQPH